MNIHKLISEKIQQALVNAGANIDCKADVRQSMRSQFGDYQVNGIMAIAKRHGLQSRILAEKVASFLDLKGIANKIKIVTPGFINIFLDPLWIEKQLADIASSPRLGIANAIKQNIVVDYSAPNIAKEMHVGHMRSTIIGDALVRILTFLGHNVIKANHVGDWGTQFGMLIAYLERIHNSSEIKMQLSSLESFYCAAKQHYDKDSTFAELARSYVVRLHSGDKYCRRIWQELVDITMAQNQKIYDKLNVTLKSDDIMGESIYNDMLPEIVADLKEKGIAVESEGAVVVFLKSFKNKEGKPMGVVIQKKDGAYLYATTDIACAKYRYEKLKADRIIYYIDSRQYQHLMQIWAIVRKADYVPESVSLEHHMFGMILDKDGKPFKTRDGGAIKLADLLDEAIARARRLIISKNLFTRDIDLERLAKVVGIGAVKYADLSKNRTTDYIFNWDNILSFDGNTAPYIQYAYARIMSIFKRSGNHNKLQFIGNVKLTVKQEIKLAIRLLQLEEVIITVSQYGMPHILCSYLYDLAVIFSVFYEKCPILNAENKILCQSRLQLALLTARTLKQGLNLLGIETVDQM